MRPGITARKETCPSSPHLRPIRTWPNARKRSSPRNSAAEVLLCDTGVLLAAGNVKDHAHQACLRLLRHAEGPLLVPSHAPARSRACHELTATPFRSCRRQETRPHQALPSVITQRGKKTIGSEHENRFLHSGVDVPPDPSQFLRATGRCW